MTVKASWREGYRASVSADIAYNVLNEIREANDGELIPEDIIKKAKLKKSPIHKAFNWDNESAANEHRLEQARNMSRSLNIIYTDMPDKPLKWLSVVTVANTKGKSPSRKVYKSTEDILKDPLNRDEILTRAINEALSYRKKYHMLSELAKIFKVMDEVIEHADSMLA